MKEFNGIKKQKYLLKQQFSSMKMYNIRRFKSIYHLRYKSPMVTKLLSTSLFRYFYERKISRTIISLTRGLFLKGTTIGNIKTAIGKFDDVPIEPFESNAHNMEVHAKLDSSGDSLIIDSKQILKGYGAIVYRPIWAFLPKDKQEDAVKDIIQNVAKSENIQIQKRKIRVLLIAGIINFL